MHLGFIPYLFLSYFLSSFFHSFFTSYPPIFLPTSLSLYSSSLIIHVSFYFLMKFLLFLLYFCLLFSLLFLFVYCLFSPFFNHRCFDSPCFRLPGRESELRFTGQQLRSSGLFTGCYLTVDILFTYVVAEKVYISAN